MAEFTKYEYAAMSTAILWSTLSRAPDKQVGAVLLQNKRVRCTAYNGPLPNQPNVYVDESGTTLPTVVHAEMNIISECARSGISTDGGAVCVTLSPCTSCAIAMAAAGIAKVIYLNEYKSTKGIEELRRAGVVVQKMDKEDVL